MPAHPGVHGAIDMKPPPLCSEASALVSALRLTHKERHRLWLFFYETYTCDHAPPKSASEVKLAVGEFAALLPSDTGFRKPGVTTCPRLSVTADSLNAAECYEWAAISALSDDTRLEAHGEDAERVCLQDGTKCASFKVSGGHILSARV